MAQTKIYPATKQQAENIQTTVNEINAKTVPIDLSSVGVKVLDFINDPVTIISGGLNTYERTISN